MITDNVVSLGVVERLLTGHSEGSATHTAPKLPWLSKLRAEAVERVGALTVPTVRDEAWRFTDISALTRQSFHPLRTPTELQAGDVQHFYIEEATTRLVFVDGVYASQLSSLPTAAGLIVGNLPSITSTHAAAAIQSHFSQHAPFHDQLFSALNTAFLHDAAVLIVPRATLIATPVHLLFISTQPGLASHPRLLILAEADSEVTLIEDYVALHDGAYFTNSVAEVALASNAKVEHVRVQRESPKAFHMASCGVALAHASRYHSVNIALGAQLSRLDLHVVQTADAAECSLDGLALISDSQLADTHTFIDHAKPHGVSRQLHKCIVGGAAHAVFNGKVMVRPGAQKTDSAQSSRNLLLSGKALVDTQPQLEIFADDVKCTHGATVGQLDSEELFYLQSRGFSEAAARNLLSYAFGAEVIERIPIASLRRQLEQTVLAQTTDQS